MHNVYVYPIARVYRHLKVVLHAVEGRVVDDVPEAHVPLGQVDRVRVEDNVEDAAARVALVEVVARRREDVRYGPAEALLASGRLARGLAHPLALADVEEALEPAVEAGLDDVTGLGVDKRHVYAPLALQ